MKQLIKINFKNAKKGLSLFSGDGRRIDYVFLLAVVIVSAFGTIILFSAGTAYAQARYGDSAYFIKKQTIWLIVGAVVMYTVSHLNPGIFYRTAPHLYAVTIILLVLVLIFGFVGNGAQRWISIGPITVQPSEIAKLTMIMLLAKYFSDNEERATDITSNKNTLIYGTLIPACIMLAPIILVMLQKHLSCIIILGMIGLLLIFCSGINPKYIYAFCAVCVIAVTALALFTDYTKERITVWQNPEAYKLTGGWQTLQGLMAIGSGGISGVGYGNSILKHCYVSEPANDMIFTILCEELGLIGATAVIGAFAFLIYRGVKIALRSENTFSRLLVLGICIKTAIQVLLNIAVVTNTIPNTGISLPFFSYGGSSLIMLFFEMGIVLCVSRYSKITK